MVKWVYLSATSGPLLRILLGLSNGLLPQHFFARSSAHLDRRIPSFARYFSDRALEIKGKSVRAAFKAGAHQARRDPPRGADFQICCVAGFLARVPFKFACAAELEVGETGRFRNLSATEFDAPAFKSV
jgi:hypothetical protein